MSLKMYHTIKDNVNDMPLTTLQKENRRITLPPATYTMSLKLYFLSFPYIVQVFFSHAAGRYQ